MLEVFMRRRIQVSLAAVVFLSVVAISGVQLDAGDDWFVEFEPAQAEAKKQQKDLLIDFGGSDWCYPCKMLKERILSKPKFIELAQELHEAKASAAAIEETKE